MLWHKSSEDRYPWDKKYQEIFSQPSNVPRIALVGILVYKDDRLFINTIEFEISPPKLPPITSVRAILDASIV